MVILKKSPFTCPDLSYLHFGILEMPKWRILAVSWTHLLRFKKKYQNSWNIPQKWLDLGKDKLTLFGWKTYFLINLNFLHFGIYWKSNKQRFTFSIFYDPIIALQFLINIIMLFKWYKIGWLSWKKVHLLAQLKAISILAFVYVSSGPVPNQTIGPKKILNYLIFREARTGPHKSVCLYRTRPEVLISVI